MGETVCMFVYNTCTTDARVLKEAASLVKGGYKVKIFAVMDNVTLPYEIRDGIEIIRVIKNPIHYRLFSGELFKGIFTSKKDLTLKQLRDQYVEPNEDSISIKSNISKKVEKLSFIERVKLSVKTEPLNFFLYKWVLFLLTAIKLSLKFIFKPLKNVLKKLLMLVHKPLCFYDFYRRTLLMNKEESSDIYHGHDLHTVPTAYKTARLTKSKVVYDAHELYTEMSGLRPIERKIYTRLERKYAPKVDHLITVNESIACELVERYGLKSKPSLIFNCPEITNNIILTEKDELRAKLNIPADTKIILYQGGYSLNRGLFNLIKSAQYIKTGIVVFMGWGNIEDQLRALVKELGLEDKVLFTPGVPQNELLNHSKSADIGVIPYQFVGLNNYYTSPNKLFEYINAKVPIAGSNFPELKRVIDKYKIGVTFDPESPQSIAESINKVMEDSILLKKFKENTHKAALDFTWEREEKKLLKIYENLTNG